MTNVEKIIPDIKLVYYGKCSTHSHIQIQTSMFLASIHSS